MGGNKKVKFTVLTGILFLVYLAIILRLLIFRDSAAILATARENFVPFKTIFNYLSNSPTLGIAIRNLLGNIMIFIPLGFFVPLLCRSTKWKTVLVIGFIASLIMETVQGVFRVGIFDVDDILLNMFGTIFGYGTFVYLKLMIKSIYRLNGRIF